jgi:hypothetical protein
VELQNAGTLICKPISKTNEKKHPIINKSAALYLDFLSDEAREVYSNMQRDDQSAAPPPQTPQAREDLNVNELWHEVRARLVDGLPEILLCGRYAAWLANRRDYLLAIVIM